jgi:adenosylcobinamide-GDP ribazoletransferase
MTAGLRSVIVAWHFLTSVPLCKRHHDPSPAELAGSMVWYPFVGVVLGAILAISDLLLRQWLSSEVSAVIGVGLLVMLTRGLHQDGLADTLDGLAGGRTPSDRLAIMKDPRIGALGATGLTLSLILRCAAVATLPEAGRFSTLLCMPVMGRWAMVVGAYGATQARAECSGCLSRGLGRGPVSDGSYLDSRCIDKPTIDVELSPGIWRDHRRYAWDDQ